MVHTERLDTTPGPNNHLAWLRTWLALERTFMAWLRTAAALIGFGFTLEQFFQHFAEDENVGAARLPRAPYDLSLMLVGVGVIALVVALWQYRGARRSLEEPPYAAMADPRPRAGPGTMAAVALIAIGVFAFVAIITRMR